MCFGGKRLTPNRHFELVAYFQSIYRQSPYNLCYNPKPSTGQDYPNSANVFVLPKHLMNTTVNPERKTWQEAHLSSQNDTKPTTMRCLDPAICDGANLDYDFYKLQTLPYKANPFLLVRRSSQAMPLQYAHLVPSQQTPTTAAVLRIVWTTNRQQANLFASNVTLEEEMQGCKKRGRC